MHVLIRKLIKSHIFVPVFARFCSFFPKWTKNEKFWTKNENFRTKSEQEMKFFGQKMNKNENFEQKMTET